MKTLYCFIGMPLSGKSYTAKMLASKLNGTLISTGDISRALMVNDNTSVYEGLKRSTIENDRFPIEEALRSELKRQIEFAADGPIFVEGYPRYPDQVLHLKENLWEYFPKVIEVNVGDHVTLFSRAKYRARDTNDTNPEAFAKRLEIASKNMSEVLDLLNTKMVPTYTLMSTSDDIMLKQFKRIMKDVA